MPYQMAAEVVHGGPALAFAQILLVKSRREARMLREVSKEPVHTQLEESNKLHAGVAAVRAEHVERGQRS